MSNKILLLLLLVFLLGCTSRTLPTAEKWGIYSLDLTTNAVELVYSSSLEIAVFDLSNDLIVFSMKNNYSEDIYAFDGSGLTQLTNNTCLDTYPALSPDSKRILYLSFCNSTTLDLRIMNLDGTNNSLFYDSGDHDADPDWVLNTIVFTRESKVWTINSDGSNARQVTNPSRAGEWGAANLPFGDYDPRLNSDASKIVFERLVSDESVHGNYEVCTINLDSSGETCLTNNGYSQGMADYSPDNSKIAYLVAAINETGVYRAYIMNSDGTSNHDIAPNYFPAGFLMHAPKFRTSNEVLFIGEYWS
jgi:Tol biopolymer transport system component